MRKKVPLRDDGYLLSHALQSDIGQPLVRFLDVKGIRVKIFAFHVVHPVYQLAQFGIGKRVFLRRRFQQLQVAIDAAAILGRARPFSFQASGAFQRFWERFNLFNSDGMAPVVAKIVNI